MQPSTAEALNLARIRRARRQMRHGTQTRLEPSEVRHSFLSDEAQEELTKALRQPGSTLHEDHRKLEFSSSTEAIAALADRLEKSLPAAAVFIAYDVDCGAAFLANTRATLQALQSDPFLISSDGFVILFSDASGGLILDYHDSHPQSPATMTLLGVLAQEEGREGKAR